MWRYRITAVIESKLGMYMEINRNTAVRQVSGVSTNSRIKGGDLHGLLINMCYKRENKPFT